MTILDVIDARLHGDGRLSPELAMLYEIRDDLWIVYESNNGSIKRKARLIIDRIDRDIEKLKYEPLKYHRAYNRLMLDIKNSNNGKYKRHGGERGA